MHRLFCLLILLPVAVNASPQSVDPHTIMDDVTHHYAKNEDVKIHYVTVGDGPLIVMLHGFPDYWYTWRDQMEVLKNDFQVVAMDLRGYNLSGQPDGVEHYAMKHLMNDVIAVIKSTGNDKAIIVGHDWGGAIAWQLAINHPDVVEKLVVCNMTHPTGYSTASLKTLQSNGNTSYMDTFREHTSESLPVSWLCGWVKDPEAKKHYEAAFARSSVDAMINYYRANTKTKSQRADWLANPVIADQPTVNVPVLAIFGVDDKYVSKLGLNNTWDWLSSDFTLVTVPDAGHFVQQDASGLVSRSMKMWLLRDQETVIQTSPLNKIEWILGSWKRTSRGRKFVERWTKISPNTLRGKGMMIQPDSGEEKTFEDLIITVMGDEIFYLPKVDENPFPIPFKLVSSESNKAVFENSSHDFPQRIEYHLIDARSMKAIISNTDRSKEIEFDFTRDD